MKAGEGHPERCRHCGETGLLLGGQLVELGKQVSFSALSCFIASHYFSPFFLCHIAVCVCVRAK